MRFFSIFCLVTTVVLATACDDSTRYQINPLLAADTVELWAPTPTTEGRPSAMDVIAFGGFIGGPRFPEQARHAEAWDFAVRLRNGELVLVPPAALGLSSRAAITAPLPGTFEGLIEAPGNVAFRTDSIRPLRVGNIHSVRSRLTAGGMFGGGCEQYAKLQVLAADPTTGRAQFAVVTNERCGDPRLVTEG